MAPKARQPSGAVSPPRRRLGSQATQARVDAPVDLLADALDEAFGERRVVVRAELGMGRHRGGDFLTLVGVHTRTLRRPAPREQGRLGRKPRTFGII